MTAFPSRLSERHALVVLRVVVALLIGIHGVARIALGVVDDFGIFLDQVGFPAGAAMAWTITLVEIGGGGLLALGYFVRPLCAVFVVQLAAGIALAAESVDSGAAAERLERLVRATAQIDPV